MLKRLTAVSLLSVLFLFSSTAYAQAPREALKTFMNTIRSMEFPAANVEGQRQLVEQANAFLDLEAMTTTALGGHWEKASAEAQTSFMEVMWELIEHVAYAQSHGVIGEYEVKYPKVRQADVGVNVDSVIKQSEDAFDISVIYHLYKVGDQWKIDDIILDGVSIIEDLQYQFDKIIQESAFDGLLERMNERLAAAKASHASASPGQPE